MVKRIVSMLLCLLMVVGAVAPSVSATQTVSYGNGLSADDIYFGEGANVVYNSDGSFTVNSSGKSDKETSSSVQAQTPAVPEEVGQASATVGETTVDALGVPKDSSLTVAAPKAEAEPIIDKMVAKHDGASSELFRYDISVQDKAGLDWQPNGMVRLEMDAGRKLHKNEKVYVVHVSDDGKANYIDAQVNEAGKIVFETNGFSTFAGFTVDFEYENAKFSIWGLSSILLSDVFNRLGMPLDVEDVMNVEFSDYSLISLEKQGNDWLLTSLEAFQTTEALTMTMKDGQVYEIKVTDAITTMANFYEAYYGGGAYNYIDGYAVGGNAVVQLFLNSSGSPTSNDDISSDFDTQPLVIDGRGVGGCMEIVLQKASGAGNTLVWDLVELKITGGAKVIIRLGASFSGTETITINSVRPYTNAARPLFNIEDGSLYFNLDSNDSGLVTGTGASIQSTSSVKQIIFDGNDLGASTSVPLIYHHRGVDEADRQNLVIRGVTFRDAKHRAVLVQTNNMNNLIFRNCTFESTVRDVDYGGGAIYIDGGTDTGSNVVDVKKFGLYNCTFSGNTGASGHGGAIACYGDVQTLDIDGCKFENCKSVNRAGAIEFSVNAKTQNNYIYDWFRIKDTTFSNCTAGSHGGAIDISNGNNPLHLAAGIIITGCTFTNCKATGSRGGAIRIVADNSRNLTISNSGFSGCTAYSWGGAISWQGTVGNVTISGSKTDTTNGNYTFKGCSAGARGGAVGFDCTSFGSITLTNAIFKNNVSQSIGGGIHVGINHDTPDTVPPTVGAVKVESCTFEGNEADGVGGGIALTEGTYASITVQDSSFTECFSANYGGGIGMKVYKDAEATARPFKVTGAVLIQDCTFSKCSAGALSPEPLDTDGDGVGDKTTWDHDGDPSTAELIRLNGGGGGGAIAIGGEVGTSITIKDTTKDPAIEFDHCYTWNNGGALCFIGTIKTPLINIENVDIDACRARDAGNAIHLSNLIANDLTMTNCDLTNNKYFTRPNTAASAGGFTSTLALMKDPYFVEYGTAVYAAYDAGGTFRSIGNTTCRAVISGCHFEGNLSYQNGAGVYWNANNIRNGAPVTKDGVTTTPEIKPSLQIVGSTFKDNIAERDGGGVYVEATVDIDDCDFESNEAWGRGGAIAQQVYSNEARKLGEGEATNLILDKDTEIWNNHAVHGGGISITVSNTISLVPTIPLVEGGEPVLYLNYPVKFQLGGATVRDNYASGNGGGIYYATTSYADEAIQKKVDTFQKEVLIDNGKIYGNKTGCDATGTAYTSKQQGTQNGGGIYMYSNQPHTGTDAVTSQVYGYSNMTITGGNIYSNEANIGDGGGIYLTGKGASCLITGGTIGADANGTAAPNLAKRVSPNGGSGGGIAIHGGATITMRRPWLTNEKGEWLDEEGNVTNDESKCVEDPNADGGFVVNNIADYQGAGIWLAGKLTEENGNYIEGTNNTINISGGTISGNKNSDTYDTNRNGGGIYVGTYGTLSFTGGTISNCTANGWGGGVFLDSHAQAIIDGGTITGCQAGAGGGVAIQGLGYLEFKNGNIHNNTATNDGNAGGGIYDNGTNGTADNHTTIIINGGNVYGNHATSTAEGGGHGGGIAGMKYTNITISSGSVYDNDATGNGGGLYLYDHSYLKLSGGNIGSATSGLGNEAENGGGVYADNSEVLLEKTADANTGNVIGNSATADGGGVYATNGATITVNGDVKSNTAYSYGGGVYAQSKSEITVNGDVVNNVATTGNGGGLHIHNSSKATISGGNIQGNKAQATTEGNGYGGGVHAYQNSTVTITGGDIKLNLANTGGGVSAENGSTIIISDGNVDQNTAAVSGGGVLLLSSSSLTISNGSITNNKANTYGGGGVYAVESSLTLQNGNIEKNTAEQFGGGVYVEGTATTEGVVTIENGNIKSNVATERNGGGLLASSYGKITISGGTIQGNKATAGYGGGVHAYNGGSVYISGGSITQNEAKRGGGIAAEINAYVEFTNVVSMTDDGGNLSENTATEYGGGIYAESSTVKVSGGTIEKNTARYGGGIAAVSELTVGPSGQVITLADVASAVTVEGGAISNNYAENGGGIFAQDENTKVVVRGGNIINNQARSDYANPNLTDKAADGSGGGIYVDNAVVEVNKPAGSDTAGMVKANHAARGGGVYVINGGTLTVKGGYIIENLAHGNEGVAGADDWYKKSDMLGTGGGIFVGDGTGTKNSIFTLLAADEDGNKAEVAIYGNLADFAADDVFASGINTDLNVPLVTQMDLAGYPFQPGGWFEDYAINDVNYSEGLSGSTTDLVTDGKVHRYRGSAVVYRIEIAPTNLADAGSLPANVENTFVCMTLGIPGAVGEEIVLDFGLPVDLDLLNNDLVIKDNFYLTSNLLLGTVHPFQTDAKGNKIPYDYQDLDGKAPDGFSDTLKGKYGDFTITYTTSTEVIGETSYEIKDYVITYKLRDMQFIGVESFTYAVCYEGIWYYADVNIIPATIIYFEENYVDFSAGVWNTVPEGATSSTVTQDGDRPGVDLENALGELDMDNVYGYDSHYVKSNKYSLGVAKMTTVDAKNQQSAVAEFTFWGTGFDIVSLCSNKTGAIMVTIKRLDKTEDERYLMVDTYYSYTYDETTNQWRLSSQSDDNATYQVPVMRVDDLAYGQYWVEIFVGYEQYIFDHGQYGGGKYDFYLDAIRIYNPANNGAVIQKDSNGNPVKDSSGNLVLNADSTIQNAYNEDGEYAPVIEELRNLILDSAKADASKVTGVLFIDRFGSASTVADYKAYGPNNELYLDKDQSISFAITNSASLAKVQLAMKALGDEVKVRITNTADANEKKELTITSSTDLYYDLSNFIGDTIVIQNVSDSKGALLSITNKKVTYKLDTGAAAMDGGDFVVDGDTANNALMLLNGTLANPEISTTGASLSFEDEVKYNVYYTVGDPADIVEMGLILFGQRLEDGTISNADMVIPGYVTNGTEYMVSTNGIPAKQMGDVIYFKVYAKLSDGSFAYSDVAGYSAATYAKNILAKEDASAESKALVVALMNYGTEAQKYFGYKTEALMNSFLTAEQQALVAAYDASSIASPYAADSSKVGAFTATEGFSGFGTSVSFEGAFAINYYVTPAAEATVTMYYWKQADYEAAEVLTAENATGTMTMTGAGEVFAAVSGIAAKEMEDTVFVAMVYEVDDVTYSTGVRAYSLAAYCKNIAAKEDSAMQALAQATAIYGSYAKAYFA